MLLSTGFFTLLCLSCADRELLGPDGAHPRFQLNPAAYEEGCTRLQVVLSGNDGIQVDASVPGECESVVPVLAGTPTFDRTRRLVRLPVALENRGERKVKSPAWLLGWEDSLAVVSPSGLAGNVRSGQYLALAGADSVAPAADSVLRGARIWKYDESLAAGEAQVLGSGRRTAVRWIEISVHPGVEHFRAAFHARARRAGSLVPAVAPDSLPESIYRNRIENPSWISSPILRGIVVIEFRAGATQAERQEAVDLVDGEVIGGYRFAGETDGWYYVRVAEDDSGESVRRAIEILGNLPQVEVAGPEMLEIGRPGYLTPQDDSAIGYGSWQLAPDSADQQNWGLEAIAAPLAWGCSTGEKSVRVGVIDLGFARVPDIEANVDFTRSLGIGSIPDTRQHGTRVSSIIGAEGNNRSGITGVMWRADLRLYEMRVDSSGGVTPDPSGVPTVRLNNLLERVSRAARSGAQVINFSFYLNWSHQPQLTNPLDTARVNAAYRFFRARISRIDQQGYRPLIVLIAGNDSLDARWNAYARLREDLPQRVIVTSATRNSGSGRFDLAAFSNHGSLVEVAAPGQGVGTLGLNNAFQSSSGTSHAAPHVTGLAGLLFSFDPHLTSEQVKDLIIRGARQGGRTIGNGPADSVHMLNAYESLKLAAQRPGAPLCGNRMWARDGEVVAQRGAGTETLFRVDGPVWEVNALHGGRDVRIMHPRGYRSFHYTPGPSGGTWAEVPDTSAADWPTGTSGATLSFSSRSHDGDLRVRERTSASAGKLSVRLGLVDTRTRAETPLATIDLPRLAPPRTSVCMLQFLDVRPVDLPSEWEPEYESWRRNVQEGLYRLRSDSTCHFFATTASVARDATTGLGNGAYSPTGETYLYVASYRTHREQVVPRACDSRERLFRQRGTDTDSVEVTVKYTCRDIRHQDEDSGAEVYAVPLPGGQGWKLRPELGEQGATLWGPRISEDGKEWSATRVSYRQDYTEGFTWHPGWREWTSVRTLHSFERSCTTRFRSLETGAVREEVAACENLDDFVPTFAPSLLPGAGAGGSGTPRRTAPPRHPAAPTRRSPART
jgi:hypothetical protein